MEKLKIPTNKPLEEFYNIVQTLIEGTQALQKYDSFAATAISAVINLMLSRDDEYVKACTKSQHNTLEIPDQVKNNVDNIINVVKEKLAQEKSKKTK